MVNTPIFTPIPHWQTTILQSITTSLKSLHQKQDIGSLKTVSEIVLINETMEMPEHPQGVEIRQQACP